MKLSGNRLFAFILSFALILSLIPAASAAAASTAVSVTINGSKASFGSVKPTIINGRVYLPAAAFAVKLNATYKSDSASKKMVITRGTRTIGFTPGSTKATLNGKALTLSALPIAKGKDVLVPAAALSDALGVWTNWNNSSKTLTVQTVKTFKHAMGSTTLKSVPQRVVILFNGMVDTSVLLGVKPVGAVESYLQQPFYEYLRPSLIGVKDLGDETQPNLEGIANLKPDLIIASKMRHEKINDQLNKIAPTVMTEDVFSWQNNLKFAADVLNKQSKADAYLSKWASRTADFKKRMGSGIKNIDVSVMRINPNGTARFYLEGFAPNILKDLGFSFPKAQTDISSDIFNIPSKEQIPLLDADYIFDFTVDWDGDGAIYKTQKEWIDNALWSNLKAVKNKKYYKVNAVNWNLSGGPLAADKMLDDLYFYFNID
ncbi:ABC transporter substrate-binding protein [Paenibacillus pasadenensis]|uniref:ABC transporter substrate-binding protein n=1 Tax=Paenibacillus pasadenensis TaxID=217090 RepID=UPI00204001D2|nr:ABC transporter substrate-binding protein [Paenibacillus pasadenensis]MCM3749532.1 ABC transporter substrate-binding protein [Paenibacillus pasadenensis]